MTNETECLYSAVQTGKSVTQLKRTDYLD